MQRKRNLWKLLLPAIVLGSFVFAFFQGCGSAAPKAVSSPAVSSVPEVSPSQPKAAPSPSVTTVPTSPPSPSPAPAASPARIPAVSTAPPAPPQTSTPSPTPEPTPTPSPSPTETPAPEPRCTISVSCASVLNNMDALAPGKAEMIPSSGTILSQTEMTFTEGESVLDVLVRACRENGVNLESVGGYIEGIGNLYEMDCGPLSGWTYSVNGWAPSYGCDQYTLSDGDMIQWLYTCDLSGGY